MKSPLPRFHRASPSASLDKKRNAILNCLLSIYACYRQMSRTNPNDQKRRFFLKGLQTKKKTTLSAILNLFHMSPFLTDLLTRLRSVHRPDKPENLHHSNSEHHRRDSGSRLMPITLSVITRTPAAPQMFHVKENLCVKPQRTAAMFPNIFGSAYGRKTPITVKRRKTMTYPKMKKKKEACNRSSRLHRERQKHLCGIHVQSFVSVELHSLAKIERWTDRRILTSAAWPNPIQRVGIPL
jgi:hypothetical protein